MAKVTVKFFATVRSVAGTGKVDMEADTVGELLIKLKKQYDKEFQETVFQEGTTRLKRFFSCMINGKRIETLDGYDTKLSDGDAVAIFPPIGGGNPQ
ncbi:MAG: hypothetical protein BAJATHORv1_50078 [Candidatus Thorarchaeota archaeon]|nr:MAG: hypothetical protein BAJATHORv1_50078 [Candidatus Thorarchaeota archaeon]